MTDEPYKLISDDMKETLEAGGIKVYQDVKVDLRWYDNSKRVHYIGMAKPRRAGAQLFFTMLEYMYFEPGTSKNSQFIMAYFEWIDCLWVVTSIPVKYKIHAKAIARKCGVRIADGVPTELSVDKDTKQMKANYFPVKGKNAFNLENEAGHPIYKHFGIDKKWFDIEDQLIRVIQGRDMNRANDFLKDWSF
jgi:hypothetical protein